MTDPLKPPSPEDIKAQYGFVAMLAAAVPEIGKLMQTAVSQKWTSERFQMAVANTNWWKKTPQATRQWFTQQVADPASAARTMRTGGEEVVAQAAKFGYAGLSMEAAQKIWLEGRLAGFEEQLLSQWVFNAVHAYGRGGKFTGGGELGSRIANARQLAVDYGFTAPDLDSRIMTLAARSISDGLSGETGLVGWQNQLKQQAKSKYAAFGDRIDAGETVRDIAQPYIDVYAQTLELNPQEIGLNDKYVQRWLQGRSEAGKPPAAVPVWQAQEDLRKDERWWYTRNAKQTTAEVATTIGKAFGMIG